MQEKAGQLFFDAVFLERIKKNWFKPKHTKKADYEKVTKMSRKICIKSRNGIKICHIIDKKTYMRYILVYKNEDKLV